MIGLALLLAALAQDNREAEMFGEPTASDGDKPPAATAPLPAKPTSDIKGPGKLVFVGAFDSSGQRDPAVTAVLAASVGRSKRFSVVPIARWLQAADAAELEVVDSLRPPHIGALSARLGISTIVVGYVITGDALGSRIELEARDAVTGKVLVADRRQVSIDFGAGSSSIRLSRQQSDGLVAGLVSRIRSTPPPDPPRVLAQPSTPTAADAAAASDAAQTLDDHEFAPPQTGLLAEQDSLALGGQLFLRFNGSFSEGQDLTTMPLSAPSLIDAFADVRPNDRLRGFAQVRFNYDFTIAEDATDFLGNPRVPFELLLDQVWVKFDLWRVAFITAGRQRIRWGTGRFWNPTDFVNSDTRDSVDFFDQRLGVNLLKVHFPFEELGWNIYLLGTLDNVDTPDKAGIAARAEFLFGELELAVSTLVKKDAPLRLGLDASAGLWLFDLRAETTIQRGLGRPKFAGDLDFAARVFPEEVDTEEEIFFSGVFGADLTLKYSDQDNLILGAEYFYNQAGYQDAKLYPFLALNGAFTPLFLGQHYVAGYGVLPQPFSLDDTSITLSTIANLSDTSLLSRIDLQQSVLTSLTFNMFASYHWGNIGELRLGFETPPIPPLLPEGFVLPTQIFDVGIAARLAL